MKIGQRLQLDRPLLFALAAKCWQAISGPITLALVIGVFSAAEQGVYYGLVSIIGIQAIFELGLLNVLISQAGTETARIAKGESKAGQSNPLAAQRMGLLIRSSQQWFLMASLLYVLSGWCFGWITLSPVNTQLDWWVPLVVVIPVAAISIALAPALAILEGAGFRESIYRFRMVQIVTGSIVVWASLVVGLKLWTIVMATGVQAFWAGYLVFVRHADFFHRYRQLPEPTDGFSWGRDVVPMQWRVALISVAHYLSSQLFVAVIVGRESVTSAADAGCLGATLTMTTAIQMLALAWVQTKFSLVSAHHGAGERETAGTMWRQTAIVSTVLLCLALGTLIGLIAALPLLGRGWELRFLQPWQLTVLSIGFVANHLLALQSFLRDVSAGESLLDTVGRWIVDDCCRGLGFRATLFHQRLGDRLRSFNSLDRTAFAQLGVHGFPSRKVRPSRLLQKFICQNSPIRDIGFVLASTGIYPWDRYAIRGKFHSLSHG